MLATVDKRTCFRASRTTQKINPTSMEAVFRFHGSNSSFPWKHTRSLLFVGPDAMSARRLDGKRGNKMLAAVDERTCVLHILVDARRAIYEVK